MAEQLNLDFGVAVNYARSDFVLGACNALAADRIDRWPDWEGQMRGLVIAGPQDSGKSHLGAIWREASGAAMLTRLDGAAQEKFFAGFAGKDSAPHALPNALLDHPVPPAEDDHAGNPRWPEDVFFHFLNRIAEAGGSVLILTRTPPAAQGWALPDLASRLKAMTTATIDDPDDVTRMAVMQKLADDLGLSLAPDLVGEIAARVGRSFAEGRAAIEAVNKAALARSKPAGPALVREVIAERTPKLV